MGDQDVLNPGPHPPEGAAAGAGEQSLAPGVLVPLDPPPPSELALDLGGRKEREPFDEATVARVVEYYGLGLSLAKIAQQEACPSYSTLVYWIKTHPSFRKQLEECEAARALYYRDKALEAAEAADEPESVPAERLRFDAYKWAAETADPAKFGKKTVVSGDAQRPIQFVIHTGVPAPDKPAIELTADGLVKEVVAEVVEDPSDLGENG